MLWLLVNGLWCSQTSTAHIGGLKEPEHVIYIVNNVDFFFLISRTVTLDRPRLVNVDPSSLIFLFLNTSQPSTSCSSSLTDTKLKISECLPPGPRRLFKINGTLSKTPLKYVTTTLKDAVKDI